MALRKTVTTAHGFEAADAYHRVENVALVGKQSIAFHVRSYRNPESSPCFAEQVVSCTYDLQETNPIAQAYRHLKTLPQFDGAKDC